MASPYARAVTGSLESQLLLEQLRRQSEERKAAQMAQLGQSLGQAAQTTIGSVVQGIDRHQQRKQQAAQFAERLGLQQANAEAQRAAQMRGQDLTRQTALDQMGARSRMEQRKAMQADLERRLKALPDLASTNLARAEDLAGARVTQATLRGQELPDDKVDITVADFRAALEKDGFKTEGIDDATMRSVMNSARQQLEGGNLELDAERKKYMDALRGVRLAENERTRLADTTLALDKMSAIKQGAMELPQEDRDLIRDTIDLFVRKKIRMKPSASLSQNVTAGFSALLGGANAGVASGGSVGQQDVEAEAIAKLEARWTKLQKSKSWAWLQKVDTFNRAYAKAAEPRLTDADWNWYESNLLTPWRGEDLFADRFNDLAGELHSKLSVDVATIANVDASGSPRADVPMVFRKAVDKYDPEKIGFTDEDRKTFSGKWKQVDEKSIDPVGEALSATEKAMSSSLPTYTATVEREMGKQMSRFDDTGMAAGGAVDAAYEGAKGWVKDALKTAGAPGRAVTKGIRDFFNVETGLSGLDATDEAQAAADRSLAESNKNLARLKAKRRYEAAAPKMREIIREQLGVDVPPGATIYEMEDFINRLQRVQQQGQ
jgi:hypothetical protein